MELLTQTLCRHVHQKEKKVQFSVKKIFNRMISKKMEVVYKEDLQVLSNRSHFFQQLTLKHCYQKILNNIL